jgi:hypothetical protein
VWDVEISDGLMSFRWSEKNVAARDRAVSSISAAVAAARPEGLPTALQAEADPPGSSTQSSALIDRLRAAATVPGPVEPSAEVDSSEWPSELLAQRLEAMSTGRPVVVQRHEGFDAYFSPVGQMHLSFGGYGGAPPTGATLPRNLVGRWVATRGWMLSTWPGEPAYVDLVASGSLGGRLHLFGAVPPLAVTEGSWCWVQARSNLVIDVRTESVEGVIVEGRLVLVVTVIEPNRITGPEGDEQFELIRSPR